MSTFSWRVLRLPLLITLLWGLLLFTLFRWTAQREDEYLSLIHISEPTRH